MRIIFAGDVFGKPGRVALQGALQHLKAEKGPFDFVIVNCENAAAGFGMTVQVMDDMFSWGVCAMTSGNHIWDKKDFVHVLDEEPRVLRPANYPKSAPGRGWCVVEKDGVKLCVISMQGRAFMPAEVESPFEIADEIIESVPADMYFVDFHAEATAEKIALARYLDGRAIAVVGTHTHVQTADDAILGGGTAYISDVGMTGGHGGVIGMKYSSVMPKFLTSVPSKFEVEEDDVRFQGVIIDVDEASRRAVAIERVDMKVER